VGVILLLLFIVLAVFAFREFVDDLRYRLNVSTAGPKPASDRGDAFVNRALFDSDSGDSGLGCLHHDAGHCDTSSHASVDSGCFDHGGFDGGGFDGGGHH
jgi:hypothetical protein